ncbi:MAG TPA: hypothetical protein VL588_04495 [Bdellovibrionota bacterium]|jgi:hypothetical protein|nr:hypothetical protein [Bdellovibrionota bacterium]
MNKYLIALIMVSLGSTAYANPDRNDMTSGRSEARAPTVTDKSVNLGGNLGTLGYGDANSHYTARGAAGVTVGWDATKSFDMKSTDPDLILGLETGFTYSHLGAAGSNYFGTSPGGGSTGANALVIPANIQAGYRVADRVPVVGSAGVAVLYRSQADQMLVGRNDAQTTHSWDAFPDLGLKVGWDVGKGFQLSLRGDYIGTPRDDLFTATVGGAVGL